MEEKKAYAQREKVYLNGSLFPFIRVGMQKVNLTPTVQIIDGEKRITPNPPVYIYDTGGPYTDPDRALTYFQEGRHTDGEYCTMCGPHFCALKLSHDLRNKKE